MKLKEIVWYPVWGTIFGLVAWIGTKSPKMLLLAIGSGIVALVLLLMMMLSKLAASGSEKSKPTLGENNARAAEYPSENNQAPTLVGGDIKNSQSVEKQGDYPTEYDDEDWAVATEHFPELNKFEETLSLYPDDLAKEFRSYLLRHKTFGQADAYAQALISSYLDRNFGSNVCVREFGRRLTENSEIMAAEELAKTMRVLGASIQCKEIKRKIVEKYSLKLSAYYDDRFDEMTDALFPWVKSIPFYYRVASDGRHIHFQTNDERLPNYVATSEDEAELIVRKIIEDDALVQKKTAASLKRGRNFFVIIFIAVLLTIFVLTL